METKDLLQKIKTERNVVFLTKYGSSLYGTSTPTSDLDIKGVFLPTKEEILLGRIPKTVSFSTKESSSKEKNVAGDIDCELYSFHYFLKLCESGQTVALELLWANDSKSGSQLESSILWDNKIVPIRDKFITKSLKAFLGYARGQAVRYSVKGDKLNTARKFRNILNEKLSYSTMKYIWANLKEEFEEDENVKFIRDQNDVKMVEVCNRAIQISVTIKYALEIVDNVISKYGVRANQAAAHDGADFKALSHAIRIGQELRQIYKHGKITFPVESANYLLAIKKGKYPVYDIMDTLENILNEVEILSSESDRPEKVDREFIDEIILEAYEEIIWRDSIR